MNVYAQVLTVSIAEIIVCWGVIGVSFEAVTRTKGRVVSMLIGNSIADYYFGIIFRSQPPFNQIGMVLFLMSSVVYKLIYFMGGTLRTIVFHIFLSMGVHQALEKSGHLSAYNQPYSHFNNGFLSVIILMCSENL